MPAAKCCAPVKVSWRSVMALKLLLLPLLRLQCLRAWHALYIRCISKEKDAKSTLDAHTDSNSDSTHRQNIQGAGHRRQL